MSLGNIKHQVTFAVISADPVSRAVGILKLAGVLKDAGINLATLLTPMTTEAIRGWSNNPEYAKQENESIVATITELPPGLQAMMAQHPMMGQMSGMQPMGGMMHDPRFGNPGMYMQPGAGLFPDGNCWNSALAYAPPPYPASGYSKQAGAAARSADEASSQAGKSDDKGTASWSLVTKAREDGQSIFIMPETFIAKPLRAFIGDTVLEDHQWWTRNNNALEILDLNVFKQVKKGVEVRLLFAGDRLQISAEYAEPFLPAGQSGNGERIFTSNWPTLPGSMSHMKLNAYSTVVSADLADHNGLHYRYAVRAKTRGLGGMPIERTVQEIAFQQGDVSAVEGPNGLRVEDLLVVCADRLQCVQSSAAVATPSKSQALLAVRQALDLLNAETAENTLAAHKSRARWS
jgi:hypothetical protein